MDANDTSTTQALYPKWQRLMEISAIVGYAIFGILLGREVVLGSLASFDAGADSTMFWLVLAATPLLAYVAAELAAGTVHCLADNFGSPDTPFFGRAFIKPFREHHIDPDAITRHDAIEANGNNCLVGLGHIAPVFFLFSGTTSPLAIIFSSFILCFTFAIVITNQIHKWAHLKTLPEYVVHLQRWGLILSPRDHAVHHTAPHDSFYCITNGWLNPMFERYRIFSTMVKVLRKFDQSQTAEHRSPS